VLAHEVQLQAGHHVKGLTRFRVPRRVGEQNRAASVKQLMVIGEVAHAHLGPAQILDLARPGIAGHGRLWRRFVLGRGRLRLAHFWPGAFHFLGSGEHHERLDSLAWIYIAGVGGCRIVFDVSDLVEQGHGLLVDAGFHGLGQIVGEVLRFLAKELLNRARYVLGVLEPVVGEGQSSPDHGREDQGQDQRNGRAEALASCAAHVCPAMPRQASL
jgi:hypothetical protein